MADRTLDPSAGDSPGTSDSSPEHVVLTASINAAGELEITGPDLCDNTLMVTRGAELVVKIMDAESLYLYGQEIVAGGARAISWARSDKGMAKRKFSAVDSPINNITYAVSSDDTGKIKYGPVITVKPKG